MDSNTQVYTARTQLNALTRKRWTLMPSWEGHPINLCFATVDSAFLTWFRESTAACGITPGEKEIRGKTMLSLTPDEALTLVDRTSPRTMACDVAKSRTPGPRKQTITYSPKDSMHEATGVTWTCYRGSVTSSVVHDGEIGKVQAALRELDLPAQELPQMHKGVRFEVDEAQVRACFNMPPAPARSF